MGLGITNRKILLIENFPSDFYNSRLPLAKFLNSNGLDVYAMVPGGSKYTELISKTGVKVIEYEFNRNSKSIFQIIWLSLKYRKIIKEHNFDIVHSFRFQPNLINTISGIGLRHKKIVHITGLGIAFSNSSLKYLFLRGISHFVFLAQIIFVDKIIFQNSDDIEDIWACRFFKKKIELINGSGVNVDIFNPKLFNKSNLKNSLGYLIKTQIYICVTRLIWEKGIKELVEAFSIIHNQDPDKILLIVGWPDFENPRHVTEDFISTFKNNPGIRFLGKRNDIPELLAISDIYIYPSYYREGIPRSLLEALSMGLPIITTDMPGCKTTINCRKNGLLIKPRSLTEIIRGIQEINKENLIELSIESRKLAEEIFRDTLIFSKIESLYK